MRYAGHAGVLALALLTLGAGVVYRNRNAGATPLASSGRADRNAAAPAPVPLDPELIPAPETTVGKAQQLWDCRRKLTAEIRSLNGRGVPLTPEELLGIRLQEGKLAQVTPDL
ncbi:MAG TPA: hypothetical protein VG457_17735, partial [Planctomycetota bacterium]|nr:hypothetical protein [Planctomycetota bacterium]